jgi:phenylacetate-coenzyme A ligase PaaK-like adenylate-forming protein
MIYKHFYKELLKKGIRLDLSNAVLIHGGGWKKLISEAVTSEVFKKELNEVCGITHVYDYYGMVEQTGTIYMECECGHLHAPVFSDVIIRRANDFSIADKGEKGIIQVVSILPKSYPGHSLLTEDEGILLGEDDCACGRLGKYFKIVGRLKNAEIRGCSDTYASKF